MPSAEELADLEASMSGVAVRLEVDELLRRYEQCVTKLHFAFD